MSKELFCTIDTESREIDIPAELEIVGVESDEDVTVRRFRMKWLYDDSDLSTFVCRVNFENAGGIKDLYFINDVVKDGDYITFSWLLSRNAMAYAGVLKFIICMIRSDVTGEVVQEWNSTQGRFTILKGLNVNIPAEETVAARDIAAELIAMIQAAARDAIEAIEEARNN